MRTTFSVAALVGFTMGQGYSNPWGYPSNTPAVVVPDPVVVVVEEVDERPEECAASLVLINEDLANVETACDVDANELAAIEAMLAIQAPQVDALVATFDANWAGIAGCTAQNSIQDFNLTALNSRINDLKAKLEGPDVPPPMPQDLLFVLEGYMTALQDIKNLVDQIAAAEVEAAAIQVLITTNIAANMALGPTGTIATLVTNAATAATDVASTNTAISDAGTAIAANLTAQGVNDQAATDLETALDMQALSSDFYEQNNGAITFDVGNSATAVAANPVLSFPVTAGQPFEFWSYLTATSSQTDGELSSIWLTDGTNTLAASNKNSGVQLMRPDRQFPLFYKAIPAMSGCMSVEYTATNSNTNMATAQIGALQWGLKKYAADDMGTYPFTPKIFDSTMNLANCTP